MREQCGLRGRRPGVAVNHHDEVFHHWGAAIAAGVLVPSFHVTHVDAHGDLGFGDAGCVYLMTSLLFEETDSRPAVAVASGEVADSDYLAFAIACRWVSALTYVYPPGGGGDIFPGPGLVFSAWTIVNGTVGSSRSTLNSCRMPRTADRPRAALRHSGAPSPVPVGVPLADVRFQNMTWLLVSGVVLSVFVIGWLIWRRRSQRLGVPTRVLEASDEVGEDLAYAYYVVDAEVRQLATSLNLSLPMTIEQTDRSSVRAGVAHGPAGEDSRELTRSLGGEINRVRLP